jgi:hypothetical protein
MTELDYTQLSLFTFCPRKYWYIYRQCLEHKVGNAAIFSSELIHPAITGWYVGKEPDWDSLWQVYSDKVANVQDDFYTLDRAKDIYTKYVHDYQDDLEKYTLISTEVSASIPIGNVGDRFISKPDLVLIDKDIPGIGVLDIKTSKWPIGADLVPFDRQFLGQVKLTGATWMMKGHAQILKREIRLTRSFQLVTPDLLDEWEEEVCLTYRYMEICEVMNIWPKHSPGSCSAFNQKCEFMDLCGTGKLMDNIIKSWPKVDPFAYLKH